MEQLFDSAIVFLAPTTIGVVLVLFGRRVFWALGALAFATVAILLTGVLLVPNALDIKTAELYINIQFRDDTIPTPFLVAAAIGGLIGILFTLRFRKAAGAVVGFSIGLFFLTLVFELFAITWPEPVRRTLFIVVGTLIAFIAIQQPEETMIILSTLLGCEMIIEATLINLNSPISAYLWLLMMLTGIIFQTGQWRREQRKQIENQAATVMPAAS